MTYVGDVENTVFLGVGLKNSRLEERKVVRVQKYGLVGLSTLRDDTVKYLRSLLSDILRGRLEDNNRPILSCVRLLNEVGNRGQGLMDERTGLVVTAVQDSVIGCAPRLQPSSLVANGTRGGRDGQSRRLSVASRVVHVGALVHTDSTTTDMMACDVAVTPAVLARLQITIAAVMASNTAVAPTMLVVVARARECCSMASLLWLLVLVVSLKAGNAGTGDRMLHGIRLASVALIHSGLLLRIHIESLLRRGLLSLAFRGSVVRYAVHARMAGQSGSSGSKSIMLLLALRESGSLLMENVTGSSGNSSTNVVSIAERST